MYRRNALAITALILILALVCAACGGGDEATSPSGDQTLPTGQPLGLSDCELTASTWSSPNGATVHLSAVPLGYDQGQSAEFVVRLDGDEAFRGPCEWTGSSYTASADLNAADGYCYYVVLTSPSGEQLELPVNTPSEPTDEALINMSDALNAYCELVIDDSSQNGSDLTITGTARIQPPRIYNAGAPITCDKAELVLTFNGEQTQRVDLTVPERGDGGLYEFSVSGTTFKVPSMEDDQQLILQLDVTLSNGQTLSSPGCCWFYNDGQLILAVG